ncbi:MAG: methylglyoxal synthase [Acidimicrobiales bacterium]|nr:methylglyoxal synthase [Acidimicrobiales bacterium]
MTVRSFDLRRRTIALVAHDNRKDDLLDWARYNRTTLAAHRLVATGTTGHLLNQQLDLNVLCFQSGPLGGDQQLGAEVTLGNVDLILFFWDPLQPQPHDPDVKALLRIAVVWNIPIACNRATADFVISSPLLHSAYERKVQVDGGHAGAATLTSTGGAGRSGSAAHEGAA